MADGYPDYDVLAKRDTLSWNAVTRRTVDERLSLPVPQGDALDDRRAATLARLVSRICPDPPDRPPTTTLAMVAHKIVSNGNDGYRHHCLPDTRQCWQQGLDAVEAEAQARHGHAFAALADDAADALLQAVSAGDVKADWGTLDPGLFWQYRVLPDCVSAHWAQPALWSAMGFGGPASPRGYVRLGLNRRDPWEAQAPDARQKGWPSHRVG